MKAWTLLPLLTACHPDSNCGVDEENPEATAVFQVEAPNESLVLELLPALPVWGTFDNLVFLDEPWARIEASQAEVQVELGAYDGLLAEIDGGRAMFFVPALFEDRDGDGLHSTEEPYLGVSTEIIAYFESVGCGVWSEVFHPGWNGVEFLPGGPGTWDLLSFEITQQLGLVEQLSLQLEMPETEGLRVALAPERIWLDEHLVEPLWDGLATTDLTISLPPTPPDEHLQAYDVAGDRFLDWFYAVELPLLYTDSDGSGGLDLDDSLESAFCLAGSADQAVRIGHYPEPDLLIEAHYLTATSRQPGWGIYVETDDDWEWVDPDLITLVPGGCPLP